MHANSRGQITESDPRWSRAYLKIARGPYGIHS